MELAPVESDAKWDQLLARQPRATLFHTIDWLRFQQAQFGYKLFPLVAGHDGEEVGLFPVFVTRRMLLRIGSSPRGIDTLFLGPLAPDELLGDLLESYEQWVRRRRIAYSCVAFTHEIDPEVAGAHGYKRERHKYRVLSLEGSEDDLYRRLSSECRRRVRQAERRGVKIIEGDLSPYFDRYVDLSSQVFARSNLKTELTRPVLENMVETLSRTGRLLSLRAEVDGQVVAMWIGGHYNGTMMALNTVSDRAFVKCSANNLMNWHAIRWSCRQGLRALDFGGSRIRSLSAFKASFGAEELFYSNIKKVHSPLARAAVWLGDATVNRLRSKGFRRSQKGSVQKRLVAGYHADDSTAPGPAKTDTPTEPTREDHRLNSLKSIARK